MISHEYKCLFVHIPRTGGSSIERFITGEDWACVRHRGIKVQHISCLQAKKVYGDDIFSRYYKFSFVRNPWDLMVSTFLWAKQKTGLNGVIFRDFIEDIARYNEQLEFVPGGNYGSGQLRHLTDSSGNLMVDYVGRFENLQKDFDIICGSIGMKRKKLPVSNKTRHRHYAGYYDKNTADLVARQFKEDIEYFGYRFGA